MGILDRIPWYNRPRRARVVEIQNRKTGEIETRPQFIGSHFLPDPTPMQPPIGYNPQPSMFDVMRQMIESERLKLEAQAAGHETLEEADDLEVDDDDLGAYPTSRYTHEEPSIAELVEYGKQVARERDELEKNRKAFAKQFIPEDREPRKPNPAAAAGVSKTQAERDPPEPEDV